jgi:hypothetical protein
MISSTKVMNNDGDGSFHDVSNLCSHSREALAASNNDVSPALKWLQNDLAVYGAKKAAHRTTGD